MSHNKRTTLLPSRSSLSGALQEAWQGVGTGLRPEIPQTNCFGVICSG